MNSDDEYQVWLFTRDVKQDEFEQRLLGVTNDFTLERGLGCQ